jgi:hypothetical protein
MARATNQVSIVMRETDKCYGFQARLGQRGHTANSPVSAWAMWLGAVQHQLALIARDGEHLVVAAKVEGVYGSALKNFHFGPGRL